MSSSSEFQWRDYEVAEIEYENAIANRYDRDYHASPIMNRHDKDFAKFVAGYFTTGDRVLDLGCGPGSLWSYWGELAGCGGLVGVDIAPRMVEQARGRWPDGDFRVGTIRAIPVETGTIDLVIASSTLHHIPDVDLPDAFAEIQRVLTEHGTLVGREPAAVGRLADEPGWLSGAIMSFRHLVYRLTQTREYPEPEIGPHHHAYNPAAFVEALSKSFSPKAVYLRHPFSSYVSRSADPTVAAIALWIDEWLNHFGGHTFYYAASKNYADAADVAYCVQQELGQRPDYDREQFLALVQAASELLEREFSGARR